MLFKNSISGYLHLPPSMLTTQVYLMGEYPLLSLVDEHKDVLPQGRVHFRWTLG
jgi:hypothetical protein